jgi:hypothetical protein
MRTPMLALLIAALVLTLGISVTLFNARTGQGMVTMRTGYATITRTAGDTVRLDPGQSGALYVGDSVQFEGEGALSLVAAQMNAMPGTRLTLTRYNAALTAWYVEVNIDAGQVEKRTQAQPSQTGATTEYHLITPHAELTLSGENSTHAIVRVQDAETEVGTIEGSLTVEGDGRTITLPAGNGTIIADNAEPDSPVEWVRVRVPVYDSNANEITMPITLTNSAPSGERYEFTSDRVYAIPAGTYTLSLAEGLVAPYTMDGLALSGDYVELPITLGEILFTVTDTSGLPRDYALHISSEVRSDEVMPNESVLVAPGEWTLSLAPTYQRESMQQVAVSMPPGGRNTYTLQESAFGAAPVKLTVYDVDGAPVPMQVRITRNNGEIVGNFFSNEISQPLPEGAYSVLVLANIAQRFDIEVRGGQIISDVPLEVRLSDLVVSYPRRTLVFIAPVAELARRGLETSLSTLDTLRSDSEGGLFVRAIYPNTPLRVPAGNYQIVVDDRIDAISLDNVIPPGETVRLSIPQPQ